MGQEIVENLVNTASKSAVHILQRLWEAIASDPKSEESHTQGKIGFKFERFKDENRCQSFQEIQIDEFKTFAEGLEKKFNLPDDANLSHIQRIAHR